MNIAIIGTGRVGTALAGGWLRAGHTVTFGARDTQSEKTRAALAKLLGAGLASIAEAAAGAEVVVLATPYPAAQPAALAAGDLTGKVLVDCTNPLGPEGLTVGGNTSGAEQLAAAVPAARVVKAFNHMGAEVMANPRYAGGAPAVMMYAGDDTAAKATVAQLAADLGFRPQDVGALRLARTLEPLALLWVTLARQGLGREFAWGLLTR